MGNEHMWALPSPAPGVSCWCVTLERDADQVEELARSLSAAEIARAARFGTPALRARYVVGRAMLRDVLGSLLGVPGASVPLRRGHRGRPEIDSETALDFNVTHTRGIALIGVAQRMRIGVDIEHEERRTNADALARKFLTPREQADLAPLEPDARRRRFLRLWTCKEAMSKATGDALSAPFRAMDVDLGNGDPTLVNGPGAYSPSVWTLHTVAAPAGYLATVALWRGPT